VKIIFAGTIGRSGLGGQAWASLQYLLGFHALGHDVIYLEDCGESSWVYNWGKEEWTTEPDYPSAYVHACLEPFGMGRRWIYRTDDRSLGAPTDEFLEFCSAADLIVMRAVPLWVWRKEYDLPRRRAFIDVDPGFTQISIANGDKGLARSIGFCERRFTYGQRIGAADCPIPSVAGPWLKTLPPVFLPEWPFVPGEAAHFTSIMRWQGFREVAYNGVSYGQRDKEFPKYLELPGQTQQSFRIARLGSRAGRSDFKNPVQLSRVHPTLPRGVQRAQERLCKNARRLVQRPQRVLSGVGPAGAHRGHRTGRLAGGWRRRGDLLQSGGSPGWRGENQRRP